MTRAFLWKFFRVKLKSQLTQSEISTYILLLFEVTTLPFHKPVLVEGTPPRLIQPASLKSLLANPR